MVKTDEPTALVIEHTVKKGSERRYENWLAEILEAIKKAPGYLGREVFPPVAEGKPYVTIVRFRDNEDLLSWLASAERRRRIREVEDALTDGDKTTVRAGIDIWFTPPGATRKAPAHKQFLLTLAVIYPITLLVPRFLVAPLVEAFPPLGNLFVSHLIANVLVVGLMTYALMPYLTHWLRGWLFKTEEKN